MTETDFRYDGDTEQGKSERVETCRRIAESSRTEAKIVVQMMKVVVELCDKYPDDNHFLHVKKQAETAKLTAYNLLGQLGEIMGDQD